MKFKITYISYGDDHTQAKKYAKVLSHICAIEGAKIDRKKRKLDHPHHDMMQHIITVRTPEEQ